MWVVLLLFLILWLITQVQEAYTELTPSILALTARTRYFDNVNDAKVTNLSQLIDHQTEQITKLDNVISSLKAQDEIERAAAAMAAAAKATEIKNGTAPATPATPAVPVTPAPSTSPSSYLFGSTTESTTASTESTPVATAGSPSSYLSGFSFT